MKLDADQIFSKKNSSYNNKKNQKNISLLKLKFIHKILDTINFSLLILIFILSFLSLNSQRKWSITYLRLSKTKVNNNNLIDYISKTEESYISKLESIKSYKKTTPKDLIYLDRIEKNEENYFNKTMLSVIKGFEDSKYQKGY
tara:strand:- start:237 stop:665 length:429 start_codon:yes stop_codon:yes gene_type:complete